MQVLLPQLVMIGIRNLVQQQITPRLQEKMFDLRKLLLLKLLILIN